jgi:hypothetical protein
MTAKTRTVKEASTEPQAKEIVMLHPDNSLTYRASQDHDLVISFTSGHWLLTTPDGVIHLLQEKKDEQKAAAAA